MGIRIEVALKVDELIDRIILSSAVQCSAIH